jgi:hypothetical protein
MDDETDRVNSLTSSQFTTVIRINRDTEPLSPSIDLLTSIQIGEKHLMCGIAPEKPNLVYQHRLRAQLAALRGYAFNSSELGSEIIFYPNEKIFMPEQGEYVITDDGQQNDLVFKSTEENSRVPKLVLTCLYRPYSRQDAVEICRVGDVINGLTIDTIHPGTKTMIVTDSNGDRSSRSWASLKCDSDGSWDVEIFSNSLLRFEKLTETNGVFSLLVSSPLCENSDLISRKSVLAPVCFTHQLKSRHFEFCPEIGRIGLVQMGHDRPRIVKGSFIPPADFEIRDRRMNYPPVTVSDLNCAKNLPIMSEEYRISIRGNPSLWFHGIGGSFNPMSFESNKILGKAIFDPQNQYGCDTSAAGPTVDQPWIAVVDRGNCMFQEKGFNMQRKGAKAVVVINGAKGGMIAALAALPGKPPLDIPVILVDRDGAVLKTVYDGKQLVIQSASIVGQSLPSVSEPVSVKSEWYCDSRWDDESAEFSTTCQAGDEILLHRDGEHVAYPATVTERLGSGFFRIRPHDTGKYEEVSGWQIFKDSWSPCTAELGSMITDVIRSDMCELTVRMHSSLLCADKRLAKPKQISKDIQCRISP